MSKMIKALLGNYLSSTGILLYLSSIPLLISSYVRGNIYTKNRKIRKGKMEMWCIFSKTKEELVTKMVIRLNLRKWFAGWTEQRRTCDQQSLVPLPDHTLESPEALSVSHRLIPDRLYQNLWDSNSDVSIFKAPREFLLCCKDWELLL